MLDISRILFTHLCYIPLTLFKKKSKVKNIPFQAPVLLEKRQDDVIILLNITFLSENRNRKFEIKLCFKKLMSKE